MRVRVRLVVNAVTADEAGSKEGVIATVATPRGDEARVIITAVRAVGEGDPTHPYPSPHLNIHTVHLMMPPARSGAVTAKRSQKRTSAMAAPAAVIARSMPTTTTTAIVSMFPTIVMAFQMSAPVTMVLPPLFHCYKA